MTARPRIAFVGSAAKGFAPGSKPTARDVQDLLDVELFAYHGPPAPADWAGPMLVAMFALIGASPQEACEALAEDLGAAEIGEIRLRSTFGTRDVPVADLALSVLRRGDQEIGKIRRCDRLIVNRNGLPMNPHAMRERFAALETRIGLPGVGLPAVLRATFQRWIRESDDNGAIRRLCTMRTKPATTRRRGQTEPAMPHLRRILERFHPLGRTTRPLLQHVGAVERSAPDRAFPTLSSEALGDIAAVKNGLPSQHAYPDELIRAVLAAWDAGRRAAEIAAHYGIARQAVQRWITIRKRGRDPKCKQPLRVRSNRDALLAHIRRHPDKTAFEVRDWMRDRRGVTLSKSALWTVAWQLGLDFAPARGTLKRRSDRDALLRFLREHPKARLRDARCFAKDFLHLELDNQSLYRFAAKHGIRFAPMRDGPSSEPARSLLLAYIPDHPEATADDVAAWLRSEHHIEVKAVSLPGFARANGMRLATKIAMARVDESGHGPEREPYKGAILAHVAAHPEKTFAEVRAFVLSELKLKTSVAGLRDFAKRHGLKFPKPPVRSRRWSGPEQEPNRSAILTHVAAHPEKTATEVRAWISKELKLETSPGGFHEFAQRHSLTFAKGKPGGNTAQLQECHGRPAGPESEPYRGAIIAHVAAHPEKTATEVRAWISKELKLETSRSGFHGFAARHGLKFAPRYPFAAEADGLLLGFLEGHPTASRALTRKWISERLGRTISFDLIDSFADRHRHRFPQVRVIVDQEPTRSVLLDHIRANPSLTADDAKHWLAYTLHIEVTKWWLRNFARRHGVRFATKSPLADAANRKALARFLSKHPEASVHDARAWSRRRFGRNVGVTNLRKFAAKRGHHFAPAWIGPDNEPYRNELLRWMRSHPEATSGHASVWLFERFGLDVDGPRLRRFAARNGLKFVNGHQDRLPCGATKRLRRDARLFGLRSADRGRPPTGPRG